MSREDVLRVSVTVSVAVSLTLVLDVGICVPPFKEVWVNE